MLSRFPDVTAIAHRAHALAVLRTHEVQCRACGRSDYRTDRYVKRRGLCPDCERRLADEQEAAR